MHQRQALRQNFINAHGWGNALIIPLAWDASFRKYFRLSANGRTAMLMDAPPEHEPVNSFIRITKHLHELDLRVPEIHASDEQAGFILLEDFGDDTFTRLLISGENELTLYERAIDTIIQLHNHLAGTKLSVEKYDFDHLIAESGLFIDWYVIAAQNRKADSKFKSSFIEVWKSIYDGLPDLESVLVLRDFHVDNLMMVNDKCALLDYQDALIGSPAYDIVSLLEDARRDIPSVVTENILNRYTSSNPSLDIAAFEHHYSVWGAQRHCKVAGIFVRLWMRDNKPAYLPHLPRVMGLLENNLQHPALTPLLNWFADNNLPLEHIRFDTNLN